MSKPPGDIDQELEAIRALLTALTPLSPEARVSAVDYVLRKLDIQISRRGAFAQATIESGAAAPPAPPTAGSRQSDIRTLAQEKRPRTGIEMAALVAYYLSELARDAERKETVTTEDLRKYFKQASFPLPGAIQYTLGNAAAAGFFESAGRGEYRLTAVGHNLIAHVLPTSGETPKPSHVKKAAVTRSGVKKKASKPAPARGTVHSKAAAKTR